MLPSLTHDDLIRICRTAKVLDNPLNHSYHAFDKLEKAIEKDKASVAREAKTKAAPAAKTKEGSGPESPPRGRVTADIG